MGGTVVVQSSGMAPSSVPPRPRSAGSPRRLGRVVASLGVVGLGVALVAGCSSSSNEDAGPATLIEETVITADPGTTVAPPSGSTTADPGTTGGQPSSPSSLPADLTGTCATLAETYGIAELRPKDTESWPDERQRVVVDARREADLLTAAATSSAPAAIAADLTDLAGYATFVAGAVEPAGDYGAAVAAIDAGPPTAPVDASAAAVAAWRDANC
jgi:hypothetical protein